MRGRTWLRAVIWAAIVCAAIPAGMSAQEEEVNLNPIKWSLKAQLPGGPLKAGDKFTVELTAFIDRGWHLYSTTPIENGPKPTRIVIVPGQGFEPAGEIEAPDPFVENDPNFGVETKYYENSVTFTIPVRVALDAPAGNRTLAVQVRYQTCNQKHCLPPKLLKFEAPVEIAASSGATSPSAPTAVEAMPAAPAGQSAAPGPDFAFTDFAGKERKISEFRGKLVLLDFWATWCQPCLADFPKLKALYEKYRPEGFEIVGLDCETLGDDAADAETIAAGAKQARAVIARFGASWTMAETKTAVPVAEKLFKVETLPTKILLDRQGNVIQKIKTGDDLEQLLIKFLKN